MACTPVLEHLARNALRQTPSGRYCLKCDPRLASADGGLDDQDALASRLDSIRCPVLLVRGAASAALSQRAAADTCARLRACDLAVVPNAGHAVVTDNPSGFESVVQAFLRGWLCESAAR
jgi:pimeloyl-ACP methyl ester carboxylesterase